jgi:hypothetical protein
MQHIYYCQANTTISKVIVHFILVMFQTINTVCRYVTEFILINVTGAPLQLNQALFSGEEKKIREQNYNTHFAENVLCL